MVSPEFLETGTIFEERYLVLGELGSGSSAQVYKARQLSTGQLVAIKTLTLYGAGGTEEIERQRTRFRREMQLCASLSHPHIVRLIDSGDHDGTLYAVFELVPGTTLREVLDTEQKLDMGETLRLMSEVLDALICAHSQGIVHRDIKPENIMVTTTGARRRALVLDFGLAGFTRPESSRSQRLTATREILGTPAYAAPEQLRGDPVSANSDLYAWGLVVTECLTGQVVMSGRTAYDAMMNQLRSEPVKLPVWLRDRPLGRLLAAVTEKDPARRNVDGTTLFESLERIRASVPERGRHTPSVAQQAGSEQRHVTVLVCGTVVTQEASSLSAPELDGIERARLELYERVAREGGGTLAKPESGKLCVVFGYPKAYEDDARRAVRVALRIRDEVASASPSTAGVRIGVHSGLGVVAFEAPFDSDEQWCRVNGAPLPIAARLEERAAVGQILVTEETRALLHENVACRAAGELTTDAERDTSLRVFCITGESQRSFDTVSERRETPLAGRSTEIARLLELWEAAKEGRPSIALLRGEAGIGKSRLVRELRGRTAPAEWMTSRCVVEDQASPLRPFVDLLLRMPVEIEQLLADHDFNVETTLPLFSSLLGLGSPTPLHLSPERQKELTLATIVTLIMRLATDGPTILAMEDLHWADPTSLELVGQLVEECRAAQATAADTPSRLLIVMTARPEFAPSWASGEVADISVGRLASREIRQMVNAHRPSGTHLPAPLVARIAERSDGIPLFVEELVHVVDAAGAVSSASGDLPIPATLRELLAVRLDGLSSSAYETVQVAATLGREFAYDVLRAVADAERREEWIVHRDLSELLDARLLYRRASGESYVFKHALVRDAAYASMTAAVRQRVHERVADVLEEHHSDVAKKRPELLAHHFYESGALLRAADYWQRAGDRSLRRAAYEEAMLHLEQGLKAVAAAPPSRQRDVHELELLITLGTVHFSTKGYAAPEVAETFSRARVVYERVGGEIEPLKIFSGLNSVHVTSGDRAATEALLPRFDTFARSTDPVTEFTGIMGLLVYAFWRGEHDRARKLLERGRQLYHTEAFHRFAEDYGYDAGLLIYAYSVWSEAIAGHHEESEDFYRSLTELAEVSFDPSARPIALGFGMAAAHARHDFDAALARATRLIEISSEQRMYLWLAIGQCGSGLARCMQDDHDEGISQLRQGLELCRLAGAMAPYSYYLTYLAAALQAKGDVDEGLAVVEEGLGLCATGLAVVHEPELLRLGGEMLLAKGQFDAAVQRLQKALSLSYQRGAGTWALRTSVSLARYMAGAGETAEARRIVERAKTTFPAACFGDDGADAATLLARTNTI